MDSIERNVNEHISSLSLGEQVAIILCSGAYAYGCSYGFLPATSKEFKSDLDALRDCKESIAVRVLGNGLLVMARPGFLYKNVSTLDPEHASKVPFAKLHEVRIKKGAESFKNYMNLVSSGKCGEVKYKSNGTMLLTFALYSTNSAEYIMENGVRYRCFPLSLIQALTFMANNPVIDNSVAIKVAGDTESFVPLLNIHGGAQNENGSFQRYEKGLYKAMRIATSENGVFISVCLHARKY